MHKRTNIKMDVNLVIPKELSFVKNIKLVLSRITGSNHFCIRKSVKNQYNKVMEITHLNTIMDIVHYSLMEVIRLVVQKY